jgi:hypothetical protein
MDKTVIGSSPCRAAQHAMRLRLQCRSAQETGAGRTWPPPAHLIASTRHVVSTRGRHVVSTRGAHGQHPENCAVHEHIRHGLRKRQEEDVALERHKRDLVQHLVCCEHDGCGGGQHHLQPRRHTSADLNPSGECVSSSALPATNCAYGTHSPKHRAQCPTISTGFAQAK